MSAQFDAYSKALAKLKLLQDKALATRELLRHAADMLEWAGNSTAQPYLKRQRSADALWPTQDDVMQLVSDIDSTKEGLRSLWTGLPETERAAVRQPP